MRKLVERIVDQMNDASYGVDCSWRHSAQERPISQCRLWLMFHHRASETPSKICDAIVLHCGGVPW